MPAGDRKCPECGTPLPPGSMEGECPRCMLGMANLPVAESSSGEERGRLAEGACLGSFKILELIGRGGMGEVYRARDETLRRDVAIKVLPRSFSEDPERLGRFKREARLLASLDHSNICAVYNLEEEDGALFIVMPLLSGDTLADRIKEGMSVNEVLPIFAQVAEGLEAAHEQGIVHRDLKPANIKVTEDGNVKILDFGLGKTVGGPRVVTDDAATVAEALDSARMSVEGVVLGTPVYMSPEQARGKPIDKRTDIWAFGCCLYESLTGQLAFQGATIPDVLAQLLEREPDWDLLPNDTPWRVRNLLEKCLRKDPRDRLRDVGDARIELQELVTGSGRLSPAASATEATHIQRKTTNLVLVVAGMVFVGMMSAVLAWRLQSEPAGRVVRTDILLPDNKEVHFGKDDGSVAVSPDGRQIAFVAWNEEDREQLYLREMDSREAVPTSGEADGWGSPRFSPDGAALAFWSGGLLKVVSLKEGVPGKPTVVCESDLIMGISWAPDGTLVYSKNWGTDGLWRVPADGGEPERLTAGHDLDFQHTWPEVLPHGEGVLFTEWTETQQTIIYLSFASRERKVIIENGVCPRYVETGHLLYLIGSTLMAAPFDPDRVEVIGKPVPVEKGVGADDPAYGVSFDVSMNGTLVYVPDREEIAATRSLVWVDRAGVETPLRFETAPYHNPRLSPNATRLAVGIDNRFPGTGDMWVYYLDGRPPLRITSGFWTNQRVWDPSGRWLTFSGEPRAPRGKRGLFTVAADGSELRPKRLTIINYGLVAFTPDGSELILNKRVESEPGQWTSDIMVLPFDVALEALEESDHLLRPLVVTPYGKWNPSLSPDGEWLAYSSDRSGRFEIWVSPYHGGGVARQVSTGGGTYPAWARDGRELFYLEDDKMMAIPIERASEFSAGPSKMLFKKELPRSVSARPYDVHPDGRFLMAKEISSGRARITNLVVVQNFFQVIERLAPVEAN